MNDYQTQSEQFRLRAEEVLEQSALADIWRQAGCRVNIVGSMRMNLMALHRDIDLHVYSQGITIENSFAVASRMAADPRVKEIRCINGLHTDEHCVAWHVTFEADDNKLWQFDIIHIESGTTYDGFFEQMADRILSNATDEQKSTILQLKFETPASEEIHGVEYYEAVIADGIRTLPALRTWLIDHRAKTPYYWMPEGNISEYKVAASGSGFSGRSDYPWSAENPGWRGGIR